MFWTAVPARLMVALGAVATLESDGIICYHNEQRADFHRPHPGKEALRYRVKDVREFLHRAGITP